MSWAFILIAVLTVIGAVAAMSLRNLVHCALMLMVALAGVAALYLQLGAQFVGFAQILIYIGAVAILIVFAILLTRGSEPPGQAAKSVNAGTTGGPLTPSLSPSAGERGACGGVKGGGGSAGERAARGRLSPKWGVGVAVAVAVFGVLCGTVLASRVVRGEGRAMPEATVRQIGDQLMGRFILPLEVIGLLLTAALIGAVLIAMREKEGDGA